MGRSRKSSARRDDGSADRGLSAVSLAGACMEDLETPRDEAERFVEAVLLAAEHVAEVAGPGEWEAFDGPLFQRQIGHMSPRDQEGVGICLAGFFTWMGALGLLAAEDGMRVLEALAEGQAGSAIVPALCARGVEALRATGPSA